MTDQQYIIKHYEGADVFLKESLGFLEEQEIPNSILIFFAQEEILKKTAAEATFCSALMDATTNQFLFCLFAIKDSFLYASAIHPSIPQDQYQHIIDLLVQDVAASNFSIKVIHAYTPVSPLLMESVKLNTGKGLKLMDDVWSYDIKSVTWTPRTTAIRDAPGTFLKQATLDDLLLFLLKWTEEFLSDIEQDLEQFMRPNAEDMCRRSLEVGYIYILYVDNQPVSMAWKRRPLRYGCALAMVYTPKEFRGKGYAAVCVGMTTEELLKEFSYVTLFVVAKQNPDKNMYTGVGYQLLGKALRYSVNDEADRFAVD